MTLNEIARPSTNSEKSTEQMQTHPVDPATCLTATDVIDAHHALVAQAAAAATVGLTTDVERARAVFAWVRDEIPHSWDIRSTKVTCAASDVLHHGTGICFAKSHVVAAMCRNLGIPAGLCYQRLRTGDESRPWVLHGLNAIYIASVDRWVRVDPRGNKPGVDAQFDLEVERLAFPPDAARGEFVYDDVFAEPDPAVVEFLTGFTDLATAWPHLPQGLGSQAYRDTCQ